MLSCRRDFFSTLLEIVAAIAAPVSAGFANDYLQVPQIVTAEWIGRIVRAVVGD